MIIIITFLSASSSLMYVHYIWLHNDYVIQDVLWGDRPSNFYGGKEGIRELVATTKNYVAEFHRK